VSSYRSAEDGRIFQEKPLYSKPSIYPASGWTETVEGYIREAKELTLCLARNRKLMRRPYSWVVHLNISEELSPKAHGDLWTKACRKLRDRGVVCLWVREPTKNNRLHYHIVVKNPIGNAELRRAFEASMPPRSVVKWRLRIEPIKKEWRLLYYVSKAKIRGRVRGKFVEDMHARKRLLLKPSLGLRKFGTVGDFWEPGKSKAVLWDEIKEIEAKIADGLETPHIHELLDHVENLVGNYPGFSRKKLERSFGHSAKTPAIRNWIDWLLETDGDHWAEYRR
jgi:hypothetical protein